MDANALIDFAEADRTLIRLVSEQIGPVHVPTPILVEEVYNIDESEWGELGITPVEPSLELAASAAAKRAGLSFHDHLCLLLARAKGWSCITNDRRLRRECEAEKIDVLWGLQTVGLLVEESVLTPAAAEFVARKMQAANPKFITEELIQRFVAGLNPLAQQRLRTKGKKSKP